MAKSRIAEAYVQLIPSMDGFSKNLDRQLAKTSTSASQSLGKRSGEGFSKGFGSSVKAGMANAVRVGFVAASAAAVAGGAVLTKSINAASDFQEAQTAVEAVFGNASQTVNKFAADAATAFGLSKNAALDGAKTFGIFGNSAGLAGEQNAKFSTDLLALAADLASFNNTTVDEAITALGAGLRGESEPLRRFGVLLDDATLRQEAFAQGIISSTSQALTPQQRVLAANAVIFKQTATQQGDFAKTSGGLANQQRILKASLENVAISLGTIFLPLAVKFVGFLNTTMIPILERVVEWVGKTFNSENEGGFFSSIMESIKPLIPAVTELFTSFSPLLLLFEALKPVLPVLAEALKNVFAALGPALLDILTALMPVLTTIFEALGKILPVLISALLPVVIALLNILSPIIELLGAILVPVIEALSPLFEVLVQILGEALLAALEVISPILLMVAELLGSLTPIIKAMIPVIKVLGSVLSFAVYFIMAGFTAVWNVIVAIGNAIEKLKEQFLGLFGIKYKGVQLKYLDMPKMPALPKLATGANIAGSTTGTPVIVGDGNKAETVTDLGLTNRFIAETLNLVRNANAGGGQPPVVNVTVTPSEGMSETELANKVVKQLRREMRR